MTIPAGISLARRLQVTVVLAKSVYKKTANKVGDFVDSMRLIRITMD